MTYRCALATRPGSAAFRGGLFALMIVLVQLLPAHPAAALDPNRALTQALLRKWQAPQGLPHATILSMCQTADGYLWLGTQSGLYRFDGARFTAAPHGDHPGPLEGLWIDALCEDREHQLWIGTSDAGVFRLRGGDIRQFGLNDGLPSLNIRCLHVDGRNTVWAGTDDGLARFAQERFEIQSAGAEFPFRDIRGLCSSDDGQLCLAGESDSLGFWNGRSFSSRRLASLPPGASVRALVCAADGVLWAGTTAGLIRVSAGNERRLTRADGLADDAVECLARAHDGTIWVGTQDGFSRLSGKAGAEEEIESFRARDGLSQSTVFALCEDHEGSLWVGTKHGLNQLVDRRTIPLTVTEGLPDNDTGAIFQDSTGRIWIGTLGKGLARYDGRRCEAAFTTDDGLPDDNVRALAEGTDGSLWIGTDGGLCRMQDGRIFESFTTRNGLPSDEITCLCLDRQGTLWAGTAAGLAHLRNGRFVLADGDLAARQFPIVALIDAGDHGLLAATEGGGVYRCANLRLEPIPSERRMPRDVDAFFQDRDGILWTGARRNGLGMTRGGSSFRFTVRDGLYDDDLFGVVADDDDRLWMACSRGIFFIRRADLLKFAEGRLARLTSTTFSPTDALRTIECQSGVQPVVWKMRDGRVWFSTVHGVIIVDPQHLERHLPLPAVHVEEVQINGQNVDPAQIPPLPPGRTNCSFRYTALSFASPTRMTFRYRLDGYDRDWIDAGSRREAFYTNLPPGRYRFRVAAANAGGDWSETPHPVEFELVPHFYQTWWFIPLATGLAAIAGGVALRLRVLQERSKLGAVLAERSRIARELHDTLIQGFSGITMQMQALAARLRPSPERATLAEIIDDAGRCLREARRSVGGLRNLPGNERELAESLARSARQLTETRDVSLRLELADELPAIPVEVEYNLLRIAQEAISNAVKHAEARTIEIVLAVTGQQLALSVSDDGVGFAIPRPDDLHGHYGLIGMRERANQIRADLLIESKPGHGTIVRVTLPIPGAAGIPRSPPSTAPSRPPIEETVP